ncbi:hypothetical protein K2173_013614 [Erythroxylum novogranatense]|uniref:non-specific serine/threonine protein kinase n=1 Tax=Erythroxylum novogranatense TaxID=1862640 RepID=A0AAV8TJZ2_9ROSI|nr:hypothetical protein K2173_013614 [Erythroxylum novogranatense]
MASPAPEDSPSSPPPPPSSDSPPPPPPSSSPPPDGSTPPPPDQSSTPPSPPPPPPQDSNDSPSPPSSNDSPSPPPRSRDDRSPPAPPSSKNRDAPPPPRSLGPPSNSSPKNSSSSDANSDTGAGLLAVGIVVGVVALLLITLIICLCACRKKKKQKPPPTGFYGQQSEPPTAGSYYQPPNQSNWGGQTGEHLPPPPGGAQVHPAWSASPPPPPPQSGGFLSTSGEMSSNFSGPHGPALPPPHPSMALGFSKNCFTYEELVQATEGFSNANLLGQGGFGYVHKGVLPNGKEIAVKSLKAGSGQGDREFQAEVEIISRVHHRHLVSLVGYCIAGGQRLLVYEYLPNYTLEHHLHGKGRPTMDWPTRLKIAVGSAKGLAYLHEDCHPRIIHRDIKGSNILLDFNCEAKVSDFGLAKLSSDNHTHVSTRVMGTFGYLAPEYASSGKLTDKSDVFSFGVMLLELITGRLPVDPNSDMEDSLVDWARPLCQRSLEEGNFDELVDPRLQGNYDPSEMARMVSCAGAAVRHSSRRRPKMSQIVRTLEGDASLDQLNEGSKPGQSLVFSSDANNSSDYDSSTYSADMKKFRKLALESQDYSSSEFGQTSEYGLNPSSSSSEEMPRAARNL